MQKAPAAGVFIMEIYAKYLPWHLFLRHREAFKFAVWVVELTGIHMKSAFLFFNVRGLTVYCS